MKGWLSRAVVNTTARGEDAHNRFARWSTWFPATPAVEDSRFQGVNEPYPRHWRQFPEPWPPVDADDPEIAATLREALDELPDAWRQTVQARDVQHRGAAETSAALGVTPQQERAMLNRARAVLRERLARLLALRHPW